MEERVELTRTDCEASPEQISYANILFYGSWLAIAIMLVTYFIYVSGLLEPHVPLKEVPVYWQSTVEEYLHKAEVPAGWGWTSLLGKGDFLNFIGVVLLAGMTIICFLAELLPAYLKKKDWLFLALVIFECVVLIVAASGVLGGGGH